jgi:predicted membrane protein
VLNTAVPLTLALETGASESRLLLTDLQVRELSVSTGASSTIVDLPARAGMTRVRVESGAASVKLRVPAGVAASISIRSALAGIRVDTSRFPKAGDSYRSADYDSAANRVEISVETGVGSIEIN